ncbi:hypothetical protein Tco_0849682 [Tanacetum coccineum]
MQTSSSSSQVGVLVPLNDTTLQEEEEEEEESRKIGIKKGVNVIGRDDLPFTDKRLSRKHLSLTHHDHHATLQLIVVLSAYSFELMDLSRHILALTPAHLLSDVFCIVDNYIATVGVLNSNNSVIEIRPMMNRMDVPTYKCDM